MREYGVPERIRTDNGSSFATTSVRGLSRLSVKWMKLGIVHERIDAGEPQQNGHAESFNGRLREECLNTNWFLHLADARRIIESWRQDYNAQRPHSALAYRTPQEFAALFTKPIQTTTGNMVNQN